MASQAIGAHFLARSRGPPLLFWLAPDNLTMPQLPGFLARAQADRRSSQLGCPLTAGESRDRTPSCQQYANLDLDHDPPPQAVATVRPMHPAAGSGDPPSQESHRELLTVLKQGTNLRWLTNFLSRVCSCLGCHLAQQPAAAQASACAWCASACACWGRGDVSPRPQSLLAAWPAQRSRLP